MHFQEFLNFLSAESRGRGLDLVLVGGWALSHYGVSRQTLDLDFLTLQPQLDALDKILESAGYRQVYRTELFVKYRSEAGGLLDVDLLFVDAETLSAIRAQCDTIRMGDAEFGVASLFHLIAMKLHALRHNRERRLGRDMPDVLALIDANNLNVCDETFKQLCLRFGTPQLYDEIVAHRRH
jgi:hypothetical protein